MPHWKTTHDEGVGAWFGGKTSPGLSTPLLGVEDFSVAHIQRAASGVDEDRIALPVRDAYLVTLYLRDTRHSDILSEENITPVRLYREGSVCIIDLAEGAAVHLHAPLDCLVFYLPRRLLDDVANLPQAPKRTALRCRRGEDDDTIRHLGRTVHALLDAPRQLAIEPFKHIGIALGSHLLQYYAEPSPKVPNVPMLSVWAEMETKAYMIAHHAANMSMAEVAAAAGLPQRRFEAGFTRAAGVSPKRWLSRYRVARAKELLAEDDLPLIEVARACGFTGEGPLNKAFVEEIGLPPATWLGRSQA